MIDSFHSVTSALNCCEKVRVKPGNLFYDEDNAVLLYRSVITLDDTFDLWKKQEKFGKIKKCLSQKGPKLKVPRSSLNVLY